MPDFIDDFMRQRKEQQVNADDLLSAPKNVDAQKQAYLKRFQPQDYTLEQPCRPLVPDAEQIKNN